MRPHTPRRFLVISGVVIVTVMASAVTVSAAPPKTKRISIAAGGGDANSPSSRGVDVSRTGRFVTFQSQATNLGPTDTNAFSDVYVRDRKTGKNKLVSKRSNGAQGNGWSEFPAISANGRFIAFRSDATNLIAGGTNGKSHVYVHDRKTKKTRLVSRRSNGTQGNGDSTAPAISANGRYVTFSSAAANLVSGDSNGMRDIFIHDRTTGKTKRVSKRSNGRQAVGGDSWRSSLSATGRYVAFASEATNLVRRDTNGFLDVFVHDRVTGKTRRVSKRSNGTQGNHDSFGPDITADGRYVAFVSYARNLVAGGASGFGDTYVHDRSSGKTTLVSKRSNGARGNGRSAFNASISDDGRMVSFRSRASNLVSGDGNGFEDAFVRDRKKGRTRMLSQATDGTRGNLPSDDPSMSGDGRFAVFDSFASTLVSSDGNRVDDAFIRGPLR